MKEQGVYLLVVIVFAAVLSFFILKRKGLEEKDEVGVVVGCFLYASLFSLLMFLSGISIFLPFSVQSILLH